MTYYNYLGQPMPETPTQSVSVSGNGGNDQTITAPAGGALVVSGTGTDNTLVGGSGSDEFIVQDPSDIVQVAPGLGGVDEIYTYNDSYTLPANVQNLEVTGTLNYAAGNSGANLIMVSNDNGMTLYGGGGNDVLVGGNGQDNFLVPADSGNDVIYNWNASDVIRLPGTSFATFAQVQAAMSQVGSDVKLQVDPNDVLIIRNTTVSQFTASNFLLKFDPSVLGNLTFDAEFNQPPQFYNYTTGTGQFTTDWSRNWLDPNNYTLTGNQESEVYVTPSFQGAGDAPLGLNPFSTSNGVLTITASLVPQNEQSLTWGRQIASGMLSTEGTFEQKYGFFEMDASFPQTPGTWPAFWMTDDNYANHQEADITESLGAAPNVDDVRDYSTQMYSVQNALKPGDPSGFHTYGLLWTPTTLTYYYDGYAVMQAPTPTTWTDPMYMIANLAMGGYGGQWNNSQLPAQMQIAWIRAYGLADGSSQTTYGAPPTPLGAIQLAGSAAELANATGYTDAAMTTAGQIVLTTSNALQGGAHTGSGDLYDSVTSAQDGSPVALQGFAPAGDTMDPQITPLAGGYWQVSYAGAGAPQDLEVYNASGTLVFDYNQSFTQGDPLFSPLTGSGFVVTDPSYNHEFLYVTGGGAWDWLPEQQVNGAYANPSGIVPLTDNDFVAWYQGSSEIDLYNTAGTKTAVALGAPASTFAMDVAALPNGAFGVAWLAQPSAGSSNYELTFETFDASGAALTSAVGVAQDFDPYHSQIEVMPTGLANQAILMWSQGGNVEAVTATGSSVGSASSIITGTLDQYTATSLGNGDIVLDWFQSQNGVNSLMVDVINASTLQGSIQDLGPASGDAHLVAVGNGGFAASWMLNGQYEARGYDGKGDYGPVASVTGDFVGVDSQGQIVAVGPDGHGGAMMQHYSVSFTGV